MGALSKEYQEPTPDEIALCAYFIWEHEGRPPGREAAHWLQAEAQLTADRKHDAGLLKKSKGHPKLIATSPIPS
jgi:hypothetical protein